MDLPPNSPHLTFYREDTENENDNVPKSAAIAIGRALFTALMSRRIAYKLKIKILSDAVKLIGGLPREGDLFCFRRALVMCIMHPVGRKAPLSYEYGDTLRRFNGELDSYLLEDADNYVASLDIYYPVGMMRS